MPTSRAPFLPLAAAATLALAGCEAGTATGLADASAPAMAHVTTDGARGPNAVPFHFRSSATLLDQELAPDFRPPESFGTSDFGGRCSVPSHFLLRLALIGEATHLGRFTGTVEHCTQIDLSTGASSTSDGRISLRAANGDELLGIYSGVPAPAGVEEHVTFTGGTGRFSNAAGEAVGVAVCDQSAGTCVFDVDGVITARGASDS
jgi:hypothetical protein